jgi:pSer/pThr/pTyr-binding forkhead associated (FHA) protein
MPLSIQVKSEQDDPPRLVFDTPRIVIGRGAGSDVRLPDTSVSSRHATIRQRGADYIVLDEGSTNGTFVGPVRLSQGAPRVVKHGDRVRVGRVWLQIGIEPMVTPTGQSETRELALRLVAGALDADGSPCAPLVQVSEGPDKGATLTLSEFQRVYTLGRSADSDLVLADEDLSRRHIQIRRVGAEILVRDLGSKNGTVLAGAPLDRERAWQPGEKLSAGQTSLSLVDPIQETLAQIDSAPDEIVQVDIEEPFSHAPDEASSAQAVPAARANPEPAEAAPVHAQSSPRRRSGWTLVDGLVALVALLVIGASVAGFIWLMGD